MIVDEEMNKWSFEFEQAVVIMYTNLTVVRKEMICVYRIEKFVIMNFTFYTIFFNIFRLAIENKT